MEQALFAALDEVSLAGAMPLRFASSPPPFASSEDSPWLGNQIVPLRSEGGTPAAGASPSPSSASETSMLNMASGVVSSVFTSPTYVGRTFYSGISER